MTKLDQKAEKKRIRKELLAKRDSLSKEDQVRAQVLITERILGHQWFYLSEIILAFVNYGSEICTTEIISEALRLGKRVYVPKITCTDFDGQQELEMVFYEIHSLNELKMGYKGILEPDGASKTYLYDEEMAKKTLLILPGVGFDPYKRRLGYGKGFYDRFLADKEGLWTRSIAIGHTCQMVPELPEEDEDVRPYQVILV